MANRKITLMTDQVKEPKRFAPPRRPEFRSPCGETSLPLWRLSIPLVRFIVPLGLQQQPSRRSESLKSNVDLGPPIFDLRPFLKTTRQRRARWLRGDQKFDILHCEMKCAISTRRRRSRRMVCVWPSGCRPSGGDSCYGGRVLRPDASMHISAAFRGGLCGHFIHNQRKDIVV